MPSAWQRHRQDDRHELAAEARRLVAPLGDGVAEGIVVSLRRVHWKDLHDVSACVDHELEGDQATAAGLDRWPRRQARLGQQSGPRHAAPRPHRAARAERDRPEHRRDDFCQRIAAIIRNHEKRLINVRVVPLTEEMPVDRTFKFRIHAALKMDPAPEPVQFDSVVRQGTGTIRIEGGSA